MSRRYQSPTTRPLALGGHELAPFGPLDGPAVMRQRGKRKPVVIVPATSRWWQCQGCGEIAQAWELRNLDVCLSKIRALPPGSGAITRCARCDGSLARTRRDARFCSAACRQAAYRDRKVTS